MQTLNGLLCCLMSREAGPFMPGRGLRVHGLLQIPYRLGEPVFRASRHFATLLTYLLKHSRTSVLGPLYWQAYIWINIAGLDRQWVHASSHQACRTGKTYASPAGRLLIVLGPATDQVDQLI